MRELVRAVLVEVLAGTAGLSVRRREQLADDLADALVGRLFDLELLAATTRAVERARADNTLTDAHAGVVTALLQLARRIDLAEPYYDNLSEYAEEHKLRPPSPDNVSIPTYLKYSAALGLTPGTKAVPPGKGGRPGGGVAARRANEQARQRSRRR